MDKKPDLNIDLDLSGAATETEKKLLTLIRKIERLYKQTELDLAKKMYYFTESFKANDDEMRKLLEDGEITKEDYQEWRLRSIAEVNRWNNLKNDAAEIVSRANEVAAGWINETTPSVFSINSNAVARAAKEKLTAQGIVGVSFELVDEKTVKNLMTGEHKVHLYRKAGIDWVRDTKWNRSAIQNELIAGILQGESIEKIATRFQSVAKMNRKTALMNARTNVTSAENAGKQSRFENLQKQGVLMEKQWKTSIDGREREWHKAANGQRVGIDEKFIVNGEEMTAPGDASASPNNVCNCRCTMGAKIVGFKSVLTEEQRKKANIKVT